MSCDEQIWMYAYSGDGLAWFKPPLGVFNLSEVRPDLSGVGVANNIVMKGGGLGILRDDRNPNPRERLHARRYKAFGEGCFGPGGASDCGGGVAISADGVAWHSHTPLPPRAGQRYDTHNNLFYDARDRRYLLTTRWEPAPANGTGKRGRRAADGEVTRNRSIAMVRSAPGGEFGGWPAEATLVASSGDAEHQLYAQVDAIRSRLMTSGLIECADARPGDVPMARAAPRPRRRLPHHGRHHRHQARVRHVPHLRRAWLSLLVAAVV